jgi:lysophospholipase L1-like esterase
MFGTAKDTFFLFGDSITQRGYDQDLGFGWVSALSSVYIRKLNVINAGLSGYNTKMALHTLPQVFPTPENTKIRFLVIFFGANDARFPNTPQAEQHVPIEEYRQNLRKIIQHPLVQAHNPKIILTTPPPVDEALCEKLELEIWGIDVVRRTAEVVSQYAQVVRDVGKEMDVAVLDVWTAFMEKVGWKPGQPLIGAKGVAQIKGTELPTLLVDGLHLTGDGNKIVYHELMRLIRERWPDQTPEALIFDLAYWGDEEAWKDV